MRHAVFIAGGAGVRLWPASTSRSPKPFIPRFVGGSSLMQRAWERVNGLVPPSHRWLCTAEKLRGPARKLMPQLSSARILGEPVGRDTLAAVGLSAAVIAKQDPHAVIAVLPADHLIEPVSTFQKCLRLGYVLAEQQPETLVTFGIKPTSPATGYGYLKLGEPLRGFSPARRTTEFLEKPSLATAKHYARGGKHLWNSGVFVWRATMLLDCIARYVPKLHDGLMQISAAWGTSKQNAILRRVYPTLDRISVDYSIMERAANDPHVRVATIPMNVTWLDMGHWEAFAQTLTPDRDGNRFSGGKHASLAARNNVLVNQDPSHLLAVLGVENLAIIHTPRATLVAHRDQLDHLKALHRLLTDRGEEDHL